MLPLETKSVLILDYIFLQYFIYVILYNYFVYYNFVLLLSS